MGTFSVIFVVNFVAHTHRACCSWRVRIVWLCINYPTITINQFRIDLDPMKWRHIHKSIWNKRRTCTRTYMRCAIRTRWRFLQLYDWLTHNLCALNPQQSHPILFKPQPFRLDLLIYSFWLVSNVVSGISIREFTAIFKREQHTGCYFRCFTHSLFPLFALKALPLLVR